VSGERPEPLIPDYGGACISSIVPALVAGSYGPDWMPEAAREARQVVLLVLDGLGWEQLQARAALAPTMTALPGSAISSVAPSTTACALTSIVLGRPPAEHGIVGYRFHAGSGDVLNVLRWGTRHGDARDLYPPEQLQPVPAFGGRRVPVLTRAEFEGSGFSTAHLTGADVIGWKAPSSLGVEVRAALEAGEPLVYAYYDGVDRIAHAHGFGAHYDAEVAAADRLVAELLDVLPAGAVLVVTSDHGQVEVGDTRIPLASELLDDVVLHSGEGRFMWLHVRAGATEDVAAAAREAHGDVAWVRTRAEVEAEAWLGGPLPERFADRVGDVALVPFEPVALMEPSDSSGSSLVCRHGSLTAAEMLVPLLVGSAR
jgi:hypothetical protein